MALTVHQAYFLGTILGDGHINYTERAQQRIRGRGPMVMLKVCDLEFIERWRDSIESITGFRYSISKHNPGQNSGSHRQQYKLRCADSALVDWAEETTAHKTRLPTEIHSSSREATIAFIQALMDSEGWINCVFSGGLGLNDMTLGFACGDPWFDDFYDLVKLSGVLTSKVYRRKPYTTKSGARGKDIKVFKMDIRSYIDAGLGFTIRRKADRLAFCSRILNDYTRDYPRYSDYYGVDDIV